MGKLNSLEALGGFFGVEPSDEPLETSDTLHIDFKSLDLRISIKRLKGNKQVSAIEGFDENDHLDELAKEIKKHCGTGGSVKDNTILIQGNQREKLKEFLVSKGAKVKLAGG